MKLSYLRFFLLVITLTVLVRADEFTHNEQNHSYLEALKRYQTTKLAPTQEQEEKNYQYVLSKLDQILEGTGLSSERDGKKIYIVLNGEKVGSIEFDKGIGSNAMLRKLAAYLKGQEFGISNKNQSILDARVNKLKEEYARDSSLFFSNTNMSLH